MVAYYPIIAGFLFWVGAIEQIRLILSLKSAYAVSPFQWGLYSLILAGYCLFYWKYLKPGRPRQMGIIASAVSAGLYAAILVLALTYG